MLFHLSLFGTDVDDFVTEICVDCFLLTSISTSTFGGWAIGGLSFVVFCNFFSILCIYLCSVSISLICISSTTL